MKNNNKNSLQIPRFSFLSASSNNNDKLIIIKNTQEYPKNNALTSALGLNQNQSQNPVWLLSFAGESLVIYVRVLDLTGRWESIVETGYCTSKV